MPTSRRKIPRPSRRRITPESLDAFRALLDAEDADAYAEAHSRLHDALGLVPGQWPAVCAPDEKCVYPPGTAGAEWYPHARKLHDQLSRELEGW